MVIYLLLIKLNDIYSLHREFLEMKGCSTMCCDVMYDVMDVSVNKCCINVKSVVPLSTIDKPHRYIHMALICHTPAPNI